MKQAKTMAALVLAMLVASCANGVKKSGPEIDAFNVACDKNFAPYTFVAPDGEPAGMLVDLWTLWVSRTGREIRFVFSDWEGTIEKLKTGRADFHSGLFENASRAKWMAFSRPFYTSETSVFAPSSLRGAHDIKDFSGQKVGAVSGSESLDYIKRRAPFVTAVAFSGPREMIRAAGKGDIAAFADERVGTWTLLEEMGLSDKFTELAAELYTKTFHAGVKEDRKALLKTIDHGLARINDRELAEIEARWIPRQARRYRLPGEK